MVGSNISVMREHHSGPGALPTVDSSDAESANGDKDSSSSSSSVVSGVQDVVGAAGGHEETYGTATVYRSKTKELEGGASTCTARQRVQPVQLVLSVQPVLSVQHCGDRLSVGKQVMVHSWWFSRSHMLSLLTQLCEAVGRGVGELDIIVKRR